MPTSFDEERSNSAVLCSKRYLGSKSRMIAVPDTERINFIER